MSIEWEWGYYGRCFIDGKFSHGVRMTQNHDGTFNGSSWSNCPEPTGTMLGVYDRSPDLAKMMDSAMEEATRIEAEKCGSLEQMRKKLREYPFQHWRKK